MPSYIVEKYAGILTKEDISQLFGALAEELQGNRSEAARQCGLTGKATYDWEKVTYIKLETKQKVLAACLRTDFLGTVEYLLRRSNDRTVDILRTILSAVYTEAMETNSRDQFRILLDRFNLLRNKHRGLIKDQIEDEAADMVWYMGQKASELGIPQPEKSLEDVSLTEWLEAFPVIVEAYVEEPQQAYTLAKTLDLPEKSIEILWPSFEKLRPGRLTTRAEPFFSNKIRATERWEWVCGRGITLSEEPSPFYLPARKPSRATVAVEQNLR